MTLGGPDRETSVPGLTLDEAASLAREHGMQQVGVRPPLGRYLADLWRHRSFLITMSSADYVARHQQNFLGQMWGVINPLLVGVAYYFIFGGGDVLDTTEGTGNYVAFLLIGLFSFIFISSGMNHGSKSLVGNMGVVRALRFPRVVLPISVSITELIATLPAFAVLFGVVLFQKQTPSVEWLLYPVAIFITFMVTMGIAMIFARVVYSVRDAGNFVPLLTRILRYVSGVFFAISATSASGLLRIVMEYQPVAVCLTMLRQTLMDDFPVTWEVWAVAGGWGIFFCLVGLVVFWQGEATYGHK